MKRIAQHLAAGALWLVGRHTARARLRAIARGDRMTAWRMECRQEDLVALAEALGLTEERR